MEFPINATVYVRAWEPDQWVSGLVVEVHQTKDGQDARVVQICHQGAGLYSVLELTGFQEELAADANRYLGLCK